MLPFNQELIWTGVFFVLITSLYISLMQYKRAVVPITRPFIFLVAEIDILLWVWDGEWSRSNQLTALISFVLVGVLILYQTFAPRRWYIFHGGGFLRTIESYDLLAKDITEFLWLSQLPPSTVILRYEGMLGLANISEKDEAALLAKIDESLEDTNWRKRGAWHLAFTTQWLFVSGVLVLQILI